MRAVNVGHLPYHFVRKGVYFALCVVRAPEPEEMHERSKIERYIHRYLGVHRAEIPRRFLGPLAAEGLGKFFDGFTV
jgi:hypothetical protein